MTKVRSAKSALVSVKSVFPLLFRRFSQCCPRDVRPSEWSDVETVFAPIAYCITLPSAVQLT